MMVALPSSFLSWRLGLYPDIQLLCSSSSDRFCRVAPFLENGYACELDIWREQHLMRYQIATDSVCSVFPLGADKVFYWTISM